MDRRLIRHVEAILDQARERDETRLQQLARRFLRRARSTE
jgi:DNA-binding GntR family transcriptional regulator